jgi:hypothetical protein
VRIRTKEERQKEQKAAAAAAEASRSLNGGGGQGTAACDVVVPDKVASRQQIASAAGEETKSSDDLIDPESEEAFREIFDDRRDVAEVEASARDMGLLGFVDAFSGARFRPAESRRWARAVRGAWRPVPIGPEEEISRLEKRAGLLFLMSRPTFPR